MTAIYVRSGERKAEDGLYHCYIVKDENNQVWEHYEKQDTSDHSWRACGDYRLDPRLFYSSNVVKVSPSECVPSILIAKEER